MPRDRRELSADRDWDLGGIGVELRRDLRKTGAGFALPNGAVQWGERLRIRWGYRGEIGVTQNNARLRIQFSAGSRRSQCKMPLISEDIGNVDLVMQTIPYIIN